MRRAAIYTLLLLLALGAQVVPARAAVDTDALILDPPAPGYTLKTGPDEWTGQVDREGNLVGPAFVADGTGGFVGAHVKSFGAEPDTGDRISVLVAEYTEPRFAIAEVQAEPETNGAAPTRFDVDRIARSRGYSWQDDIDGVTVQFEAIGFVRGSVAVYVAGIGLPPGIDRSVVEAVAAEQHRHVAAAIPDDGAGPGGEPTGLGVVIVAAVLCAIVAVAVVALLLVVRAVRRRAAPAAPWAPAGYGDVVPGAAPGAPGGFAPPSGAPPPPPPPGAAPYAAAPYAAPVAAPPASRPAPAAAPAPAPPVPVSAATLPAQECPSCGNVFGPGDACAACQHLRTMCAVCGVRIWAGAMTCASHSGAVRTASF